MKYIHVVDVAVDVDVDVADGMLLACVRIIE